MTSNYDVSAEQLYAARGREIIGADGRVAGVVEEIYLDDETGEPKWLALSVTPGGPIFLPVRGSSIDANGLRTPYTSAVISAAPHPRLGENGVLAPAEEIMLFRYYAGVAELAEAEQASAFERQLRAVRDAGPAPGTVPPVVAEDRKVLLVDEVPVVELRILSGHHVRLVDAPATPRAGTVA
jgi:sporulation protein YlmC with PRC-barrel domain